MSGVGTSRGPEPGADTEWLFDLGNTRLKFAPLLDDGTVGEVRAIARSAIDVGAQTPEPPAIELPGGAVAHVASVASPDATGALLERLTQRFARIQIARTLAHCNGLRIAYAEPSRLGVDRFLAMLAAHNRVQAPALLVAVGTALTVDLLDADGRHRGGRIAPSPALMREALQARAPQLPRAGGAYAEFAADTDDALASGCEGAALALIERSLAQAQALLGTTPRLLLHGGGAPALQAHLPQAEPLPALVLEGLALWAQI